MLDGNGNFARVAGVDSAAAQRLFVDVVEGWRMKGVRAAGVVEETHGLAGRVCTAGVLRDVGTGERHSIFLDILPPGKVCHIDADGAEAAGASVLAGLADCDVVVLSKFGKLEADGRGLAGAFEAAAAAGKPVLTWVGQKHLQAWEAFAPDAKILAPSLASIELWWSRQG